MLPFADRSTDSLPAKISLNGRRCSLKDRAEIVDRNGPWEQFGGLSGCLTEHAPIGYRCGESSFPQSTLAVSAPLDAPVTLAAQLRECDLLRRAPLRCL